MRVLRSALRWMLGLEALIFLVGGAEVAWKVVPKLEVRYPGASPLGFKIFLAYGFITGIVAAIAAWRIKRPGKWWEGLAVSLMNLLWLPFGPILSAAGLFYFFRKPAPDPVLDRVHKPVAGDGTSKWSGVVFVAAQIIWVWLVYSRLLHWTGARGMHRVHLDPGTWFLTLGLAIYASITIHELGHFALGRAVGFRLVSFRLGPLNWMYRSGRWRLRLQPGSYLGGHTAMVPENADDLRGQAMIMTLGGPLGSAALGAAGLGLLFGIPGPAWPVALGEFVVLVTSMGFGDFVLNLFPVASGVSYSDGARFWQLYRRGPWADYLCAIYYMGLSRTTAMRPGEWPSEMVEHAAAFACAAPLPNVASILGMAYVHFEDRGDVERAGSYMERACASAQPGTEAARNLAVDRAYFEALHRRNGSEGTRWLEQAPAQADSCDYWRSKAAVLCANGDLDAAEEAWRKGWELASKLPEAGVYETDRRQYRMIAERLREAAAEPAA
jgi:hypothetical protein